MRAECVCICSECIVCLVMKAAKQLVNKMSDPKEHKIAMKQYL